MSHFSIYIIKIKFPFMKMYVYPLVIGGSLSHWFNSSVKLGFLSLCLHVIELSMDDNINQKRTLSIQIWTIRTYKSSQ